MQEKEIRRIMTIDSLIAEIDGEIKRLQQARVLLSSSDGRHISTTKAATKGATGKRRTLSAAPRKRIAEAQRK